MARRTKLLVVTGGGDCPGLNAVIRAVVRRAVLHYDWEVVGSEDAFNGILSDPPRVDTSRPRVHARAPRARRDGARSDQPRNPFDYPVTGPSGETRLVDRSDDLIEFCNSQGVDCVVSIGGDGSTKISQRLFEKGLNVVFIPKTIDNDLALTDFTFGFFTAVETATDAIDRLHTTGESHHRIMVLEVMGRYAGWIALASGLAGGADHILIPEIPFDLTKTAGEIAKGLRKERRPYAVVVVAEGAHAVSGGVVATTSDDLAYKMPKLGGVGLHVTNELQRLTGIEARYTVLGHLQRGGSPVPFDRILASEFGVAAVDMVAEKKFGHMVALQGGRLVTVPLEQAIESYKNVDLAGTMMRTARGLGIGFGDTP